MHPRPLRRLAAASVLAMSLAGAHAQSSLSGASLISTLPIAVSVAAPLGILSSGAALSVVAVESASEGIVWVLERTSDGARASVQFAGRGMAEVSLAAGALVVVTAIGAGWLLSVAGETIAFVPNRLGASLLYSERITR